VKDFTGYDIDQLVEQLGTESGYKVLDHRLDLHGLCPECVAKG
jgi:Fe2+ or Zn2+ uptake regulation protein